MFGSALAERFDVSLEELGVCEGVACMRAHRVDADTSLASLELFAFDVSFTLASSTYLADTFGLMRTAVYPCCLALSALYPYQHVPNSTLGWSIDIRYIFIVLF